VKLLTRASASASRFKSSREIQDHHAYRKILNQNTLRKGRGEKEAEAKGERRGKGINTSIGRGMDAFTSD
jgi:hypothetical protein